MMLFGRGGQGRVVIDAIVAKCKVEKCDHNLLCECEGGICDLESRCVGVLNDRNGDVHASLWFVGYWT